MIGIISTIITVTPAARDQFRSTALAESKPKQRDVFFTFTIRIIIPIAPVARDPKTQNLFLY